MASTKRRLGASVAAIAVAASLTTLTAPAQASVPTPVPARQAVAVAEWLANNSTDGLLNGSSSNFGENLDFGLSLANTGASSTILARLTSAIDGKVKTYAEDGAAQAAKAAWFYESIGSDPTHAGTDSINLITPVEEAVDDTTGAFGTDGANQTLAVLALRGASSSEADKAAAYLEGMQCADGSFAYNNDCTYGGDVFDTAYAVLALAGRDDASTVLGKAITYLESQQQTDGGVLGYATNAQGEWVLTEDANDTGLAGWAFEATGETDSAKKAAGWLTAHQIAPDCGKRGKDAGALMWTQDQYATGVTEDNRVNAIYSSAQALAALTVVPAATPLISAPKSFVKAGSTVSVKVSGLNAGEVACLSGGAAPVKITGPGAHTVKAPAGTANRALKLVALGSTPSTTIKVLGAKKLGIGSVAKVKRGKKLTVTVSGLAAGEKVTVRFAGRAFGSGVATKAGKLTLSKKVAKTIRAGKRVLTVTGQFADRTGSKKIKVTR